jgi:hypothetical protein
MEDQRGGRETAARRRLLLARMEDDQRRQAGNSNPPTAAPHADGEEGRGRRSLCFRQRLHGSSFSRWRTRAKRERAGILPHELSSALCSLISPTLFSPARLIFPCTPPSVSARTTGFPARLLFSPSFLPRSPMFPAAPHRACPYGACLPRSGTNRMPNRCFSDAMLVRRTPYQSEESRLPKHLA